MDNGTLTNIVLGEEAPFLQEIFGVFNFLFRCQGWTSSYRSLNQLFTDPEDKDAQSVSYHTYRMLNDCTLILDKENFQDNLNMFIIPIKK